MPMNKQLKVYKASAGSGKTFTLAVEYIKLLIQNPEEYKFILAVTFTNKATGEMKTRILSQLYGLANGLEDSNGYLEAIKRDEAIKKLNLSDIEIRERCGEALHRIIHDYSRFRIETIDSFFQSIIRDLTRELDLTANLRVDLNAQEVLEEAVDDIIDEIDKRKDVFNSVLHFVKEKIDAGSNWHINDEVSKFGQNIFKEDFLRNRELITEHTKDAKNLILYKKDMQALKKAAFEGLANQGNAFLAEMDAAGITFEQIKYGSNLQSFINKMINGMVPDVSSRINGYINEPSNLVKDKKAEGVITTRIHSALENIVTQALPKYIKIISTVDAVCNHLNHLMLLNVINEKVRELNTEANRFLLADSAHFLNEIIDGSDVPFIYEKAGTWFKHIMIDEFQDTSALQWENFKPLISNSMSNQDSCLIVGDVKQSIYRWRDSDWQILNKRINDEFSRYLDLQELKTNYRSAGQVIHFNNQFFRKATEVLNQESDDLRKAYADVRQNVPEKNEGQGLVMVDNYVNIDYEDETCHRILDTANVLHEQGVDWNDMTILVRKNKFIPTLCQYFNEHRDEIDTKIVSDEAFRLDSSPAVNLIILALTAICNPNNKFHLRNLAIHYQMALNCDYDIKQNANEFFLADDETIDELLPKGFRANIEKYSFTPLHELIEELYSVLSLESIEGQDSYLFFFHDQINSYVEDNQTDIDSFLTYWEEKLCEKTIPNGASDGIRIMSIHKSKGLEFHTVIVPYCDWDINGSSNDLIWCKPSEAPYNNLPIVPINSSSKLENSIFKGEYREEVLKNNVDNLNLIYVAFTRASKNLVILTGKKPRKNPPTSINTIQQLIVETMSRLMGYDPLTDDPNEKPLNLEETNEGESTTWICGHVEPSKSKEVKSTENVLDKPFTDITTSFVHEESNIEFRQSNESEKLILGDEEDEEAESAETKKADKDYLERGLLYHKIFELIKTKDDVDNVIDELDGRGYFDSVLSVDEARKNIKLALENPIASRWFEEGWKEYKECAIIFKDKNGKMQENRPDRVITNGEETIVIDYKSGHENPHYSKQVSWYMYLLKRMGYKNIKGYIWYFMQNKIETVEEMKGGKK